MGTMWAVMTLTDGNGPGAAIERLEFNRQKQTLNIPVAVEAGAACSTPIRSLAVHASAREVSQAQRDVSTVM